MTATARGTALLPHHLDDLRSSGLTDATIAAAGVYSESDPDKIRRLLRWNRSADALGSCLCFPYRQLSGELNGFAMVKPDSPRIFEEKTNKYEHPIGVSSKPYFTRGAIDEIKDQFYGCLLFTEGQKKALASDQAGYPCIGLTGPWGWMKKDSDPRQLSDDLAAINWTGRRVVIIFDTDPRRNFSVNFGLSELARALTEHGAIV